MKPKYVGAICILCGICHTTNAFTVTNFGLDPFDVSAATYRRVTDSGDEAALVKISLPLKGMTFNGNTVGEIDQISGEYWVYLDPGSISLTLTTSDQKDVEIIFADYGISSVEKSCTYKLSCKMTEAEKKLTFDKNKRQESREFKTPRHLSVAYKFKGERYYLTHDEWLQQPKSTFFNVDIEGLVIEFGGRKFIYTGREAEDANGDYLELDWEETQTYLRNHPDERLMSKAEVDFLFSIANDFDVANAAGSDGGAPYFTSGLPSTWLSDRPAAQQAWFAEGMLLHTCTLPKNEKRFIHTVIDIKE